MRTFFKNKHTTFEANFRKVGKLMKRNSKILIILSAAVVFAVAASFCIYQFLAPQRSTVYIFKDDYEAGTTLTADMLTPLQVDSNMVAAGAKASVGQQFVTSQEIETLLRSGDSLKSNVGKGTPLMPSLLSATGGNAIEMAMQSTAVAVTIDVSPTTGITNDLTPGTSVNVYVTYHTGNTQLLFEKMRILAVHKAGSGGALSGVTLEVTNEEAIRLINATKNGSLYLGLINAGGYQSAEDRQESSGNIDDALSRPQAESSTSSGN